jgi:hypothetical protein
MIGQIAAFMEALRGVINVRSSTRASMFKEVDRKLNTFMAAHTEFSRIIRSLENGVSDLLRLPPDVYGNPQEASHLVRKAHQLVQIHRKANETRDERRAARRMLYEEAKAIASSPTPIIAGALKYMDEEEETRVRVFMSGIVIFHFLSRVGRGT